LAVLEFHLGVNHIDTEELSAGEEHLAKCLRLLRPYKLSPGCVSLSIQAQVRCGRTQRVAKRLSAGPADAWTLGLSAASRVCTPASSPSLVSLTPACAFQRLPTGPDPVECIGKKIHERHPELEHNAYHPMEWAINAATLSQFYINKLCFMEARHCLSAANVIFGQIGKIPATEETPEAEGDVPELYHQRKGEIARCWIKYCLTLLQNAELSMQDNIGELDLDKQSELRALRKKELEEEESIRKKAMQFGSGELCDAISAVEEKVRYLRPLDFEEARELFLLGQHYVSEAKEFFQIDGYVTDHIEVVQDHSSLFKVLTFFETDMERRCKMHKRRIAMLEPLTADLNPQYYLLVNRQIQFEIAHAYYDMMDLKVAIADKLRDPDSHIVKKINNLNKHSLQGGGGYGNSVLVTSMAVPKALLNGHNALGAEDPFSEQPLPPARPSQPPGQAHHLTSLPSRCQFLHQQNRTEAKLQQAVQQFLQKLNIEIPNDPAIPLLLDAHPTELKIQFVSTQNLSHVFLAVKEWAPLKPMDFLVIEPKKQALVQEQPEGGMHNTGPILPRLQLTGQSEKVPGIGKEKFEFKNGLKVDALHWWKGHSLETDVLVRVPAAATRHGKALSYILLDNHCCLCF
ncbi:KIF1-binding protein, partial [Octodon degus]|uniref:KIF-binding protein n=1 Tax=Octodon degus TaxID=10160 RepID=A0A6P6F2W7_OCTDE